MRYKHEDKSIPGSRDAAVDDLVAEPVPERHLSSDLEVAVPPCGSLGGGLAEEEIFPGADVEVEPTEEEDGVVQTMLVGNCKAGEGVEMHYLVVVGTSQRVEEACRDREKWDMLDIWIMFRRISDDVVDVMVAFPPAYTQSTNEVGDENADAGVNVEVVRDAHVARVVGGEDELVPEEAHEDGREGVVAVVEEGEGGGDEEEVAEAFNGVSGVGAVVEAFTAEAGVEFAVFADDSVLGEVGEGGIVEDVVGWVGACECELGLDFLWSF